MTQQRNFKMVLSNSVSIISETAKKLKEEYLYWDTIKHSKDPKIELIKTDLKLVYRGFSKKTAIKKSSQITTKGIYSILLFNNSFEGFQNTASKSCI